MRCAGCKWWDEKWSIEWDGLLWCECLLTGGTEESFGYTRKPGSRMYAEDHDGYHCGICTRVDFGCVLFEPKEPPCTAP
jgi:hypothetical protein